MLGALQTGLDLVEGANRAVKALVVFWWALARAEAEAKRHPAGTSPFTMPLSACWSSSCV